MDKTTEKKLLKDLKINMHALGIAEGAGEVFAEKILAETNKRISKRRIITTADLYKAVAISAKKYNPDLAYVYQNHDKII